MCGIIAYAGAQDALPVVLDGLRRLEYRGYDSAGIAVVVQLTNGRPPGAGYASPLSTAGRPTTDDRRPPEDEAASGVRPSGAGAPASLGSPHAGAASAVAAVPGHSSQPGGNPLAGVGNPPAGARIEVRRAAGKLDRLAQAVAAEAGRGRLAGHVALGHTRWATHGPPTARNAHPHADCTGETVVTHNGIVENYEALRATLQAEGHTFTSDTDTEVIAHLVERHVAAGAALPEAAGRALAELRGANAVCLVHARWPALVVAGRTGHAGGLVLGRGAGETFVASDLPAILERTREVAYLESGELAVVSAAGAEITRLDGTPVARPFQIVPYDPLGAAKGGYRHFMLKEIHEQPRALLDTLQGRLLSSAPWVRLEDVRLTPEGARALHKVVFVGCGTAWHAGLVGKFLVEELAGIPVEVDYASEFRYRRPLLDAATLVVAISQSGETADTLVSMEAARQGGAQLLAIVNVVGSQAARLARDAAGVLYTRAGPEIGVASTKAFTAQLAALALLALYLAGARQTIPDGEARGLVRALEALPDQAATVLGHVPPAAGATPAAGHHPAGAPPPLTPAPSRGEGGGAAGHHPADPADPADATTAVYQALASRFHRARDFLYLGRGIEYPIALEGALKLKEISYIHAEGYPAGEMKHGPIALLDRDVPVVAIALRDRVYAKMVSNIQEARAREGQVIAIGSAGDEGLAGTADHVLAVPDTEPRLWPILATIPLQLLAYYIAVRRGCDVDQPRHLAKSVTVE